MKTTTSRRLSVEVLEDRCCPSKLTGYAIGGWKTEDDISYDVKGMASVVIERGVFDMTADLTATISRGSVNNYGLTVWSGTMRISDKVGDSLTLSLRRQANARARLPGDYRYVTVAHAGAWAPYSPAGTVSIVQANMNGSLVVHFT